MTKLDKAKLAFFFKTLIVGAAMSACFRVGYLIWKHPTWNRQAAASANAKPLTYQERCAAIGCVPGRIEDNTAHVAYNEICICSDLPQCAR